MNDVRLLTLSKENKDSFLSILEKELCDTFEVDLEYLPENYGRKHDWSLINSILNDKLDSYQLIYVDDKIWAGSGGMIRDYHDCMIYQAGFRMFSKTRTVHTGLGSKSYIHQYNTKYQIERAKILGCSSVILSFNEYNKQLFDITTKYHLPKIFGKDAFTPTDEPVIFNGTKQWLLTMLLK